jgi:hypothetical protein
MQGLAQGVAKGVTSELSEVAVGWALTSIGLDSDPNAEIVAALEQIEQTLLEIEGELADISEILQQTQCQNAANVDAIQDALSAIDSWVGRGAAPVNDSYLDLVNDAQQGQNITARMQSLFAKVLTGNALENLLVGLDNALRDQGNAQQLISACGLLIELPTDEWDDRVYFQQLIDLVDFYAEYQARAAVLVTEAYHFKALQAWIAAGNDPASLLPERVQTICDDPVGDVAVNCDNAADAFDNIRTNLRAQYAEAGAPYSSGTPTTTSAVFGYDAAEPIVQMHNATGFVWVKDIDDFFRTGGYSTSCQASKSSAPCGPGVGNYDHLTFETYNSTAPILYGANGGYTLWRSAPVAEWTALTPLWAGSGTTFAALMQTKHGFLPGASTARVYFSGDAHDGDFEVEQDGTWHFHATRVACFVATPMNKGNSNQPFCSSGFGNLMHATIDHINKKACVNAVNTPHGTLDDAGIESPFFAFLYNMQSTVCSSDNHPEGRTFYPDPPGWLLQYRSEEDGGAPDTGLIDIARSAYHNQYHWPAFDSTAVTCTAEPATGRTRSRFALNGRTQNPIPRLCGKDFDAWFDKWIAPPAVVQAPPTLATPPEVEIVVPAGSTAALAEHEVSAIVHFEHLVSVHDPEDGRLPFSCFPASGESFQLGTTEVHCHATDSAGARSGRSFDVHVRYPFRFEGLLGPTPSSATPGQAMRVAFSLAGERGLDAVVGGGPTSAQIDCNTGEVVGEHEPALGRRSLQYRGGNDLYSFVWQTQKSWVDQCRELVVEISDGTRHVARVDFGR